MYSRRPTWLALFLSLFAFLALARLGNAAPSQWQEVHAAGVDVRVSVERDGTFRAEHRLSYRVVAGTLRAVELDVGTAEGDFEPQGTVAADDGTTASLFVVRDDKGKLHLSVDDAKGLKRGNYTFIVHSHGKMALQSDGSFLEATYQAPAQREGIDGMRVVFDLPSAPTEPQAKSDGAAADAILSTVRRRADRDELELVRPHVGRGEGAIFRVRVDRKAISALVDPALQAKPAAPSAEPDRSSTYRMAFAVIAALALLVVLRAKLDGVRSRARGAAIVSGLLPVPRLAVPLAALAFGGAVFFQSMERYVASAALLGAAIVLAAVRVRPRSSPVLAPGTWAPVDRGTLRTAARPSAFDATRTRGLRFFLGAIALVAVAATFAMRLRADAPYLVLLDASLLVPIFFTGTESQLGATVERTLQLLERCRSALAKSVPVAAVGHVPRGATAPDEVRLLALPKLAMPGLVGLELGVAWEHDGEMPTPRYGVLVRVLDGSFAAAKVAAELKNVARPVTGRRPEERVYAVWPRLPLAGAAVGLVEELGAMLRDRRKVIATAKQWAGDDRRQPADVERAAVATAA